MLGALNLAIVLLLVLFLSPCRAQDLQDSKTSDVSTDNFVVTPERVAILPWIYIQGTPGAQTAARTFLETSLKKSLFFRENSFDIIPEIQVILAWNKDLIYDDMDTQDTKLPSPQELLRLGEKLGVDWVISGRAMWHTRSVWIGLGSKTKADCTVDLLIVDVKKKELSLDARKVNMNNAPRENPLKAATTICLGLVGAKGLFSTSLPFTVVSGGPKTPPEINAAQSAIAKAIQPWLTLHPRNRKIDMSSE